MIDVKAIPYPGGKGKMALRPLFKYTGGKSKMIKHYAPYMPPRVSTYIEPFLGGASMFIHVLSNYQPSQIYLGDNNTDIINIYRMVQTNLDGFMNELKRIVNHYSILTLSERKAFFLAMREEHAFNNKLSRLSASAMLFFLMKTCFNGQYTVTTNGKFYTFHGEMLDSDPIDYAQVIGWHRILKNVNIYQGDWLDTINMAGELPPDSFVFLDPPYRESNLHDNDYMQEFKNDDIQDKVINYVKKFHNNSIIFLCNMERDEIGYFDDIGEGFETVRIKRKVKTHSTMGSHDITEILVHNNIENNVRIDDFFK